MPANLPRTLVDDLLAALLPWIDADRDGTARLALRDTATRYAIAWEKTSAREVGLQVIERTTHNELLAVLRELQGLDASATKADAITSLCASVAECIPAPKGADALPAVAFHQASIRHLTHPNLQLDTRFVSLTILRDQGPEAQGTRFIEPPEARTYTDLRTLLNDPDVTDPCVVLLGNPGGGKTTLLRRLQLDMAIDALAGKHDVFAWFVPLNDYPLTETEPRDWLAQRWTRDHPNLPSFEALLQQGRLLLLLDALNELKRTDAANLFARIDHWREFLPAFAERNNRALITCRSLDYSLPLSNQGVAAQQVQVKPMSAVQIGEFLRAYLPEQATAIWAQIEVDRQQLELYGTPYFLKLLTDVIKAQGDGRIPEGRAELFSGFVRAAVRREVDRRNPLFLDGALLNADDLAQISVNRWARCQLPERGLLLPALSALAFDMQRTELRGEAFQVRTTKGAAITRIAQRGEDVLKAGAQINMLDLRPEENDAVLFYHQLLQEFFAARQFAQQPDFSLVHSQWRADLIRPSLDETLAGLKDYEPLPPPPTTGWEETVRMAAALLFPLPQGERVGVRGELADTFISALADANLPLAGRAATARDVRISPALNADLQQRLLARMRDPAADLRVRIEAGLALGDLGDPRFVEGKGTGPDGKRFLWPSPIDVPGGDYIIGDDDSDRKDDKPAHTVALQPFAIGKFAVTNAEYRCFVDAGGYDDERWWETDAAKAWRQGEGSSEGSKSEIRDIRVQFQQMSADDIRRIPSFTSVQADAYIDLRNMTDVEFESQLDDWYPSGQRMNVPDFWEDPRFNNDSQPVVGICWHEARAYCDWLSAQTGQIYRLPTEAEYEAAARGIEGRTYAYGAEFDTSACNTFESHIRRTTPVGLFANGETPEHIADLSGNIWEWTSSAYLDYPYDPTPEREDPSVEVKYRVLRGGSWRNLHELARAASRVRNLPDFRSLNFGFRVVRPS